MVDKNNRGQVFDALSKQPAPASAHQLAAFMGWKPNACCKYLGLLFNEGRVERERIARPYGFLYLYRIRPPVVDAPASQWEPEQRLAERLTELENAR